MSKSSTAPSKQADAQAKYNKTFPSLPLEESLKIAKKIKELNGGKPWVPTEVATALEMTPRSVKYWYLTASSRDYGLTIGTRDTPKIELTELGRDIVYAPNPEAEQQAMQKSFFSVKLFKDVFEHYQGSPLPEIKYIKNTLEDQFGLPPKFHEEFYAIFQNNIQFLKLPLESPDQKALPAEKTADGEGSGIVTIGQPKAKSKLKAFVIMPFVEKTSLFPLGFFNEVLNNLISPAGIQAGFKVETARRDGSDIIQSTIINDLLDADLVIADLTEHNPNVLFELGLRMAFEKPIALIRSKGTAKIFDVDNMLRVFDYSANLWTSTLAKDIPNLTSHITATWENKDTRKTYMKILKNEEI
jgi:hypothetical protein